MCYSKNTGHYDVSKNINGLRYKFNIIIYYVVFICLHNCVTTDLLCMFGRFFGQAETAQESMQSHLPQTVSKYFHQKFCRFKLSVCVYILHTYIVVWCCGCRQLPTVQSARLPSHNRWTVAGKELPWSLNLLLAVVLLSFSFTFLQE